MNLLGVLENGLFALGQVLRLPVMGLLWACIALTLYYAGQSLVLFVSRRSAAGFDIKSWVREGGALDAGADRAGGLPPSLRVFLVGAQAQQREGSLRNGGLENLLSEHEEEERRALSGLRALVKIGPSLGLIGTLIPMGSSLAAMAGGDLQAMAGQMVVAFTTTIVGLATGTVAYALVALRQPGMEKTIRERRYLAEVVAAEMEA